MLLEGCRLFEKYPDVASFLRYILVDEVGFMIPFRDTQIVMPNYLCILQYQDTNAVQYDLIRLAMDNQKSLTIVGDPDQSIYGFRNADVTNFNKMHTDYKNVTSICLEQNYRSTLSILQAASIVINNGKLEEQWITKHEFVLSNLKIQQIYHVYPRISLPITARASQCPI